jgi:proteasome accessory factor B
VQPPPNPRLADEDDDPPPDRRLTPSEQKLQRWVDLLAALLIRQHYATFDDLAKDVPGYDVANGKLDSVLRTFERDKDELRRFGVPIETVKDSEGEPLGYRVERRAFYLPYLVISGNERDGHAPLEVKHDGYRSLETLAFEPDELDAIVDAAGRVRALGDPILAVEADAAIRKLALDLPLGAVLEDAAGVSLRVQELVVVPPKARPDAAAFERLSDALARRKIVTFDYYTMERDERSRRTVEPYGLFFVSSHWYLAGRDVDRDGMRNFRLNRVSRVDVNSKKAQSADYEVPAEFSLREHAQAREPWEIGDGDAASAIVEFVATTGATQAAIRLGKPVAGSNSRRAFDVRRTDAFARWLLSFGGDARPVGPAELCAEYDRLAAVTLERYASGGGVATT